MINWQPAWPGQSPPSFIVRKGSLYTSVDSKLQNKIRLNLLTLYTIEFGCVDVERWVSHMEHKHVPRSFTSKYSNWWHLATRHSLVWKVSLLSYNKNINKTWSWCCSQRGIKFNKGSELPHPWEPTVVEGARRRGCGMRDRSVGAWDRTRVTCVEELACAVY